MGGHPSARKCVAFFPAVRYMSSNPYWPVLASALENSGVHFDHDTPTTFNWRWLLDNRDRIEVLHLHYCQPFYQSGKGQTRLVKVLRFAIYMLLARSLGFRTVFTLHNLDPTYRLQPDWMDYLGHLIAVNFSERVIVHCKNALRLLAKRYGRRTRIFIVDHPNFIGWYPNTISKEDARKQLNLSIDSKVYSFFGGVRPNKGIELLIHAFRQLKDESFRLVIAGKKFPPDSYSENLQKMAKRDSRISFHQEHIPDDEIQVFMNATDVVVLPFAWILTSSSAYLAMSFGRPLIVPDMGCLPELVDPDVGWLFEPNNPDSLAKTMQTAVTSDLIQIGQRALNKVSTYSPERFAMQTKRVYWD
jgi:glycosyltransferase involved in cell wall biosynthesis